MTDKARAARERIGRYPKKGLHITTVQECSSGGLLQAITELVIDGNTLADEVECLEAELEEYRNKYTVLCGNCGAVYRKCDGHECPDRPRIAALAGGNQ